MDPVLSSRFGSATGGAMNSRRSLTCMLPVVVLLLAFSLAIGAQGPLLPTLARLDALKLASIEGDVPVRYSKGASRDCTRGADR